MIGHDCSKCSKQDVCKYIEEKNNIYTQLKEIVDNNNILKASIYCIYFDEKPKAFR